MRFLIIGGSDAGIAAGLRAHELDPTCEITLVLADDFPNYSICGLPFFLSGETPDWHSLAHRTEFPGIRLMPNHTAESIDPVRKSLTVRNGDGAQLELPYDKLLIGTGARPVQPEIEGFHLPGVFPLHTMDDSFAVHRFLEEHRPKSAVIVGAGYIGLEMADALTHRGIHVTVASRTESVLATVDSSFGRRIEAELKRHGVEVSNRVEIRSIGQDGGRLIVAGTQDFLATTDLVLVAVGVRPNSELGVAAGITVGAKGALCVNRRMETNIPDIYAAGDCIETWHRFLNRYTYMPLGTTAHKQGRIAAENAIGGHREFAGSLGTQVVKLFDVIAARTGLRDEEARRAGFEPFTVETTVWDHKAYYPGAHELHLRVTGDLKTGQLLGAQMVGHKGSEVSKRVDVFAAALFHGMTVDAMSELDLSYTPPLSSPWDPVQMACQSWQTKLNTTTSGDKMFKVIFACIHNAGRSQMAAAFFNQFADPQKAQAVSAGTEPGVRVHPEVQAVMQEVGIDLASAQPQKLTEELAKDAQLLITMGCGDKCPYVPGLRRDDWPLRDPKGLPMEEVRAIRNEIKHQVENLVSAEQVEKG